MSRIKSFFTGVLYNDLFSFRYSGIRHEGFYRFQSLQCSCFGGEFLEYITMFNLPIFCGYYITYQLNSCVWAIAA